LAAPVTRRFGRWWLAVAFLPPLGLAGVLGIGQARAALPSNCDQSGIKVSCQFSFTGAHQTFTVPAGTSSVDIVAVGAPGGASGPRFPSPVPGGAGALARGTLKVTGGQVLHVEVGGPGDDGFTTSVGGFNGGGMGDPRRSSGPGGGGGGGASDVRTAPYSAEPGADTRLLVAAGGGGAGAPTPAFRGIPGYYVGGAGGAAGQPGAPGYAPCLGGGAGDGGRPGTASSAGSGGSGGTGGCGQGETPGQKGGDGVLGRGGGGSTTTGVGVGGGGGGLYGGAQGVFDPIDRLFDGTGGGGGGGSSLVPAGGSVTPNADGLPPAVTISYTLAGRCFGQRATIVARAGGRLTRGTPGNDVIAGSKGADRIASGGGRDLVCSRGGADLVSTGAAADTVSAGPGEDRISTGGGADRINPGSGRDRVSSGSGNDRISPADGTRDVVDCGPGRDRAQRDRADRLRSCERIRRGYRGPGPRCQATFGAESRGSHGARLMAIHAIDQRAGTASLGRRRSG
jgi:hypothetical protein